MEHVPGRVFIDPTLPAMTPAERRTIYSAMCDVLTKIHKVNLEEAKLTDYGKQGENGNLKITQREKYINIKKKF